MPRSNLKTDEISPSYIKVMVILAKSLSYPQRLYHKMRASKNSIVKGLFPFLWPVILVLIIPAYAIGALAIMFEAQRQQKQALENNDKDGPPSR